MKTRTKDDIKKLISIIGFTLQEEYTSMTNTYIEAYEMGKLIIRFHNGEVTLNHDDENSYIFYIENDYELAYKKIQNYFKVEYRKGKIKLLSND